MISKLNSVKKEWKILVDEAKVRDILLDTLITKYKRMFPKAWFLGFLHEIPGEAKYNSVSSSFSKFTKNVGRPQNVSIQHPPDVILMDIRWEGDWTRILFYLKSFY